MSLGKRVKEYRVNNNIDQKEFAEKIDVTQPYLSHIFKEKVMTDNEIEEKKIEFSKKIRDTSDGKELEVIDNRITEVR